VDNVIRELREAKNKYFIKNVHFVDNIFIYDLSWLKEFSKKYKEQISLPFMCDIHSQYITEEILGLLESAGCASVNLGIQAVREDVRKNILHRYDTNSQIASAINLFKKSKIYLYAHIICNLPEEEDVDLTDTAEFLNRHRPDMILQFFLRYYPRTEIVEIAKQRNVLNGQEINAIERNKEYSPFDIQKSRSKDNNNRLASLILMSQVFPETFMNFVIKNKFYGSSLPLVKLCFHPCYVLRDTYKKIFKGKKSLTIFLF
jgi:radical SAM superfamily enzyme YgiQ (UPF0313 family)